MTSHYEVLHVSPSASREVIEAAYKALIKRVHPDAGGSAETTVALNRAREVLLDPEQRRLHDAELRAYGAWGPPRREEERDIHSGFATTSVATWDLHGIPFWVHERMGYMIVGFAGVVFVVYARYTPEPLMTAAAFAATAIACLVIGVFCSVAILSCAAVLAWVLTPLQRGVER